MEVVIVTKHKGAVEWLGRRGITGQVIEHVKDPSILSGKTVVGVLPMHLAARCKRVGIVEMTDLPAELRGQDLTADEMDKYGARLSWYVVRMVE